MNEIFVKLKRYGLDKNEIMERFVNDEEFYLSCYRQALEDEGFEQLKEYINNGERQKAFDCAHSLKGIISNIGLIDLYKKISDVVEILRGAKEGCIDKYYDDMMNLRKECLSLL